MGDSEAVPGTAGVGEIAASVLPAGLPEGELLPAGPGEAAAAAAPGEGLADKGLLPAATGDCAAPAALEAGGLLLATPRPAGLGLVGPAAAGEGEAAGLKPGRVGLVSVPRFREGLLLGRVVLTAPGGGELGVGVEEGNGFDDPGVAATATERAIHKGHGNQKESAQHGCQ